MTYGELSYKATKLYTKGKITICEYLEMTKPLNREIEQEPKTGNWIAQDIHNCHTDFKCSECGYIHSFMHLYGKPTADYTYCPNCGARMAESEEKE